MEIQTRNEKSLNEQEQQLQAIQDIVFIKHLMARNQKKLGQSYPFLYVWGTYMMIGFGGMQFNLAHWPKWYWAVASIVCSILSLAIGIHQDRKYTGMSQSGGFMGWMYWLPFAVTLLSGMFLMLSGIVKLEYISLIWLILIGITYVSMAPLIGKGPAIIGIWLIVLAVITRYFLLEYQFIILGLFGGGSLVGAGVLLQLRRFRHE